MRSDDDWMQLALAEGRKGRGLTSPNPAVGAVIVKGNQLIGKGWHQRAGRPHAEREAIADVLKNHSAEAMQGATIYVTLEPCSTHGKTSPCTQGIIDHGIKEVVYGAKDPNPDHAGNAVSILEKHGIKVRTDVCKAECMKLIREFAKVQLTGLPWVILKTAISLDGKITRPPGESQWLTSAESRKHVQKIRYECDAIITGGNTLRKDDPVLTIRDADLLKNSDKQQLWRMILTQGSKEDLPKGAQVFTDEFSERTLVQENGDIKQALLTLADKGCNIVLLEAGGMLNSAYINANLVDEVAIFYAPLLTGGDVPGFGGSGNNVSLTNAQYTQIENDILLRADITPPCKSC